MNGEGPDNTGPGFLFTAEGVAVEVTQLFHEPCHGGRPRERESFQQQVIRRAEKVYEAAAGVGVHVTAYFGDRPLSDVDTVARSLAQYVSTHAPRHSESSRFDLPTGFQVVSISPLRPGEVKRWWAGRVSEVPLLTRDLVATRIVEKNSKLRLYRHAKANTVWLLIAAPLFPQSSCFRVPDDVVNWRFETGFDKVLLLSGDEGQVFDLQIENTIRS